MKNMKRNQKGLTLIEIMITLGVAAIVLSFGVPRFQLLMQNNRISTYTNALIGSLNLARSEAIKRGSQVTIRIKSGGAGWQDGWEIVSNNTGEVLRDVAALGGSMDMQSLSSETSFIYLANGFFGPAAEKSIYVCDSQRTGETGRTITISVSGKAKVSSKGYTCS